MFDKAASCTPDKLASCRKLFAGCFCLCREFALELRKLKCEWEIVKVLTNSETFFMQMLSIASISLQPETQTESIGLKGVNIWKHGVIILNSMIKIII